MTIIGAKAFSGSAVGALGGTRVTPPRLLYARSRPRFGYVGSHCGAQQLGRIVLLGLFICKARLKERPDRLAQDHVLNLAQVGILKPAAQRLVVVHIEGSILFRSGLEPLIDLLVHVTGKSDGLAT
jgi:hypothetical protein